VVGSRECGNEMSRSTLWGNSRLADKSFSFSRATLFHAVRQPHSARPRAQSLRYASCVEVPSFATDRSEFDDFLSPFVAVDANK